MDVTTTTKNVAAAGSAAQAAESQECIYMCMPNYGHPHPTAARQFWARALDPDGPYRHLKRFMGDQGGSLLGMAFDIHWATALNLQAQGQRITRFAMLHSDVVPNDAWLDTLLADLDAAGADVMAAVVAIKDDRGVTSTAIDDPADDWDVLRRISTAELARLPVVFGAADCGYPDNFLLANTGCWVCDFTKPWRFHVNFNIRNRIVFKTESGELIQHQAFADPSFQPPKGEWVTQAASEDWEFSRKVGRLGGRVLCTKRVRTSHMGEIPWPNDQQWGDGADASFVRKFLTPIGSDAPAIPGWLEEPEGRLLARLARDRRVLELGSYLGLSTVWMARVAASVVAVDTFDGRATGLPLEDTYEAFCANLRRHGVADRVRAIRSETREALPALASEGMAFDVIFIDAAHDAASVAADFAEARRLLRPGGMVAFHDYGAAKELGVKEVVDRLLADGWQAADRVGSVIVLKERVRDDGESAAATEFDGGDQTCATAAAGNGRARCAADPVGA